MVIQGKQQLLTLAYEDKLTGDRILDDYQVGYDLQI